MMKFSKSELSERRRSAGERLEEIVGVRKFLESGKAEHCWVNKCVGLDWLNLNSSSADQLPKFNGSAMRIFLFMTL